ncbi:Chalcone isomerase-like protein [Drosera capensis]
MYLQEYKFMGSDVIVDEGIVLPSEITLNKPLPLLGHGKNIFPVTTSTFYTCVGEHSNRSAHLVEYGQIGITGVEIHFLPIKHTAIGIYIEPEVVKHLQKWKGKTGKELAEDDGFFEAVTAAPVEIVVRVVVIKEIKASQYGSQLEGAVRDRLAAVDKYEEEEEEALENVVKFFPMKYVKKGSFFTIKFPVSGPSEIVITNEEKEESTTIVENSNVAEMIKKWYLGGTRAASDSTIASLAERLAAELAS